MLTKNEMFYYYLEKCGGNYMDCLECYYPELIEDRSYKNELGELFDLCEMAIANLKDFVDREIAND